jgi:F-type H+-transporting ATPase subunit epsilon
MAKTFQLAVVAPDKTLVDEAVDSVIAPGVAGYFGIMADHEPFVTALREGIVTFRDAAGAEQHIFVAGGFCETSGTSVTIIADAAELASDAERAKALVAAENARRRGASASIVHEPAAE